MTKYIIQKVAKVNEIYITERSLGGQNRCYKM